MIEFFLLPQWWKAWPGEGMASCDVWSAFSADRSVLWNNVSTSTCNLPKVMIHSLSSSSAPTPQGKQAYPNVKPINAVGFRQGSRMIITYWPPPSLAHSLLKAWERSAYLRCYKRERRQPRHMSHSKSLPHASLRSRCNMLPALSFHLAVQNTSRLLS